MKLFNSFLILSIVLGLTGCMNNVRRAEPVNIRLPVKENRLVEIAPQTQSKYNEAIKYLKNNKPEKARKILQNIANKNAGISGVHLNLALIYYHSEKLELARKQVDIVLRISPQNIVAYNLSGTLYRKQGKYKLSRNDYATALKLSPDYADAHLNMAILFDIYLQYWEDARQHYLNYLKLSVADNKQVKLWLQDLELRLSRG